jgi:hypothetical protein
MDIVETGWADVNLSGVAVDRDKKRALMKAVMSFRVP